MPDTRSFLTFTQVCKGLPGIKPRLAHAFLRATYFDLLTADEGGQAVQVGTRSVTAAELKECFLEKDSFYGGEVVSPRGARLLVELYEAGAFELQKGQSPGPCSAELQAYCLKSLEPELTAQAEPSTLHQERLSRPDLIGEADFSYVLLNDLFWKHLGKGEGTLQVGPVQVSKHLQRYCTVTLKPPSN